MAVSGIRGAAKRVLWCRWFHRWRPVRDGRWYRVPCVACKDFDYGERRMNRDFDAR